MKVIIKYPPEYNTPVKVHDFDDKNDAVNAAADAEQKFGQAVILTDEEYLNLFQCTPKNCRHGY